ncbi:unnamed protein product [Darwinula stevensoni]|uniref:Uncharacterized protein n=1 Tax=Darwinula stevensoni TaxID=69355 RepID=A0A7R9A248_9CRUS|nr:unnamed protein product [Darwinula stevensoni]CAG0878850.1 unnamed protein product [Darwinula stevensoni]
MYVRLKPHVVKKQREGNFPKDGPLDTLFNSPREETMPDEPLEFQDILPDPRTYDKMHPPKYGGNATVVLFHVTVMSLDSIDESSMTYAADVFFSQTWGDYRLRLPDNMTSTYRLLPVAWLKDIWRPDSFFKNAKQVTFQEMTIPNHYIWLYGDKSILYMVKLTLVLSCAMNFKSYPHDVQTCAIKIESISYTTDDLVFQWDPAVPLVVDTTIQLPQLELIKTEIGDCTTEYSTGNFTCLQVVFTLKRRLGYYLFHTYVPTCLIVIMSWISFWIKPEAVPARVTLGVTSLLTLSTQHANSQKSLPPVSYIKAMDVFMSSCTVFVFMSLMEYALVNILMGDLLVDADESAIAKGVQTVVTVSKKLSAKTLGANNSPEPTREPGERLRRTTSTHRNPAFDSTFPPWRSLDTMNCDGFMQLQNRTNARSEPHANAPPPPPVSPVTTPEDEGEEGDDSRTGSQRRDLAITVDRCSRVIFPSSFAIFNILYWNYYVGWPFPLLNRDIVYYDQ